MKSLSALLLPILPLLAVACGASVPESPGGTAASGSADRYVVRGEVVGLPGSAGSGAGFYVRHEAIDEFRDAEGNVVGMESMTMMFPVSDPALLEGLAVGDKVELVYLVDWHGDPMQELEAVRRLSPDVELELGDPPGD